MKTIYTIPICLGICLTMTCSAIATEEIAWNQYRGPNGDGLAPIDAKPPVHFSEQTNLKWKTSIPGTGWSSPVTWKQQIWLTSGTADGGELFALCIDRANGKIVHQIKLFDSQAAPHKWLGNNSPASPTPVVEDGRVYLHFGSEGTACIDTQSGKILWQRRDLPCDHRVRAGSSPIIEDNLLILTMDGVDQRYVIALDKHSGETIWRTDRKGQTDTIAFFRSQGFDNPEKLAKEKPNDNLKSYATPIVISTDHGRILISPAAEFTYGYDLKTGAPLWHVRHRGMGYNVASRPVYANGMIYLTTGIAKRLLAVRPGEPEFTEDITESHTVWSRQRSVPNYSSPLVVNGLLFTISDTGGIASCIDAETGTEHWRHRIGTHGTHWASPIHADGKIWFVSESGSVAVIEAGKEFKLLAENELNGSFRASPAIMGDSLLLRSQEHLYCFEGNDSVPEQEKMSIAKAAKSEKSMVKGTYKSGGKVQIKDPATFYPDNAERTFSGPQPGEKLPDFQVIAVGGLKDGQLVNPLTLFKDKPLVLVFTTDDPVAQKGLHFLTQDTQVIAKRAEAGLTIAAIVLDEDHNDSLREIRKYHFFNNVDFVGLSRDGREGPGILGLNRHVTHTVVFIKDGKVLRNFTFPAGMLYTDPHVLGAIAELIGEPGTTVATWLNDSRSAESAAEASATMKQLAMAKGGLTEEKIEELYVSLLSERPDIRDKVQSGKATKQDVIEWMLSESGKSKVKK